MIKVLRMNPSGLDGIRTVMTFEFTFDNPNELPKNGIYTMNQAIYLIADNSIAINNLDNSVYTFNGKNWIKTNDKIIPDNTNTITSNGNYILSSSSISNTTNVNVDILNKEPTFIEKTITENGEYNAIDDNADGYSSVDVNVSTPEFYSSTNNWSLMQHNEVSDTWMPKTWNDLPKYFNGSDIWTDGENIYWSNSDDGHYILDKSTSTWYYKQWFGTILFDGTYIWTDSENIYYSGYYGQYVLDKVTSTWTEKTWNGLTTFYGDNIWTDGDNIYYSNSSNQYVLNKSTSTWSSKTWTGLTTFRGDNIWTDGIKIYYDYSYVLDRSTFTWHTKSWDGIDGSLHVSDIWTDGNNIYYYDTSDADSYYLPIAHKNFPKTVLKTLN